MKRDFQLAPPASVSVELFDRDRDVNGNPTAHYLLQWDNGESGADYESGHTKTTRRVQVGYRDKVSGGAIAICGEFFPGTVWEVEPGTVQESPRGDSATCTLTRRPDLENAPVIFRADRANGEIVAFFPIEPWSRNPDEMTSYARLGQHGAASVDYFRTGTRPAKESRSLDALRSELQGMGYRLSERKRLTPALNETRAARCAV